MRTIPSSALALLAALSAASPALCSAQSNVTINGSMDVVARRDSGVAGGSIYSVGPGGARSSRLTIGAREDMGGGLVAQAMLEAAITPDTGASANPFWSRSAAVGVGSDRLGYIALGRQFTPIQAVAASPSNDPFGGAWIGGIATVYSKTTIVNNAITYQYGYTSEGMIRPAPRSGLGVVVMFAPGEATPPDPSRSGDQFGFNASYGTGPYWVGYAYHQVRGSGPGTGALADQPLLKQQVIGAAYDFGFARLHLGFNTGKNNGTAATLVDRRNWSFGITAPAGPGGTFRLLYGKADDRTTANKDFSTLQLAYQYDLSKRTAVYIVGGQVDNSVASSAALAGITGTVLAGKTDRSVAVGIRHIF